MRSVAAHVRRAVGALVALLLAISFAPVAFAQTDVPVAVEDFLEGPAASVVAQGSEEFQVEVTGSDSVTFGEPRHVFSFSDQLSSQSSILTPSDYWISQVIVNDEPVGALSIDAVGGAEPVIDDDARLTAEARDPADGSQLIYDDDLSAWFVYRGDAIEPADDAGAGIILGAIPLTMFLKQRAALLEDREALDRADITIEQTIVPEEGLSGLQIALLLTAMIGVAVVSLLWLRWDQMRDRPADDDVEFLGGAGMLRPGWRRARTDSFATPEVLVKPESHTGSIPAITGSFPAITSTGASGQSSDPQSPSTDAQKDEKL